MNPTPVTATLKHDGHGHGGYHSLEIGDDAWSELGEPSPQYVRVYRGTPDRQRQLIVLRLRVGEIELERRATTLVDRYRGRVLVIPPIDADAGTQIEILSAELRNPTGPWG